ncbi:MAG: hypothetical protein A2252_09010 [Elusimicrobia bacterium RIFOXYA2_FULL_39_19]|nr:MAG: hypothetical protein A2252_09010 [Elusimicrobia bacterium RIFOXYA2_FULL_39_19]
MINPTEIVRNSYSLDFTNNPAPHASIRQYYRYYGLEAKGAKHIFGTFESNGETLYAQFFIPEVYYATIVLTHGYQDHTGLLKNLIENCLKDKYAVAVYDMQGFGLSSGERASIKDFSQYTDTFSDFIKTVKKNLSGPYYLISLSMGASISMEYILNRDSEEFSKVIFASPLIRPVMWHLSKIGYYTLGLLLTNIPRIFRADSSDEKFLEFYKNDPLQHKNVRLDWVGALFKWNKRIKKCKPKNCKMLILQGTKDRIVNWKYNLKFLKKKFPQAGVLLINGADHQLFNENAGIKQQVFMMINKYLLGPNKN